MNSQVNNQLTFKNSAASCPTTFHTLKNLRMSLLRYWTYFSIGICCTLASGQAQDAQGTSDKIAYENHFEKAELDKVPSEFLVLDGGFAVKQDGTNKFLELPGAPLETFGVLFGPTLETDVEVTAKIRGTGKGRRFPTFAIGLNGVGGYRLQVSPAKKLLELFKGDEVVATAPFENKLDSWFLLRLENRKVSDGEWTVSGNVWPEKSAEPKESVITFSNKTKPVAGRASIWGSPYSGTPIQFDELKVSSLEAAK